MRVSDFLKGHIFLFDKVEYNFQEKYHSRLIGSFILMGFILIPGIQQLSKLLSPDKFKGDDLIITLSILFAFLLLMKWLLHFNLKIIGLHPWKTWPLVQKSYLIQVVPIALTLFIIVYNDHLRALIEHYQSISSFLLLSALSGFIWGILQEFVYRGLLQNVLVKRFGAIAGILVSNLIFTFGPLHFYYFNLGSSGSVEWTMFAAIFGIGLLFGTIYHRSGNLWIPAILHGLWVLNWQ